MSKVLQFRGYTVGKRRGQIDDTVYFFNIILQVKCRKRTVMFMRRFMSSGQCKLITYPKFLAMLSLLIIIQSKTSLEQLKCLQNQFHKFLFLYFFSSLFQFCLSVTSYYYILVWCEEISNDISEVCLILVELSITKGMFTGFHNMAAGFSSTEM